MTKKVLKKEFFERDSLKVGQELLGKYLVRKIGNKEMALMINEVEVYDGHDDKASHASKGKTKRNEVMFGPAGYFYVYLVYGFHFMLNVVTREKGYPAAILIRGAGELNGPGKLTKFLKINKSLNGKLAKKSSDLWFEDRGEKIKHVKKTSRIGVNYAGPIWAKKQYRFLIKFIL